MTPLRPGTLVTMSRASTSKSQMLHNKEGYDTFRQWLTISTYLFLKPLFYVLFTVLDTLDFFISDSSALLEAMDPSKIAKNQVKSVSSGELCRLGAQQISQLKPRLDENKVRFVAIGLEELGVEDFVKGEFFKGELYIDLKKECYKKMGFRRLNVFTLFPSLFGKKTRDVLSESKEKGIDGNFAGDGWQNGGALVVNKGGRALLQFRQESPGDHVDPNDVLKALGIEGTIDVNQSAAEPVAECSDDACALPPKKPVVECNDEACAMPPKKPAVECTDDACALPKKS
ncbi:hypothetical protein PoB_004846300 [Plakobranchus ocellatus]|uniref:Prostamide/prostaglandin F synthase n=1 Tax=Plakobranchus ocellatus TaxID=259542 RepID=A0AAV4BT50_9GAST|nr:hypothetical protein PoB_004846300 [Plakobranchus ocellatus]